MTLSISAASILNSLGSLVRQWSIHTLLNHVTITDYKSFGQLAEMLLFYSKVSLFVYESNLRSLLQQVHPKILVPFLEEHKDSISLYCISWGLSQSGSWILNDGKSVDSIHFELGDEEFFEVDEPYLKYLDRTSSLDTPDGYIKDKKLTRRLLDLIKQERVDANLFQRLFTDEVMVKELPDFIRQFVRKFPEEPYYYGGKRKPHIPRDLTFTAFGSYSLFDLTINTKSKLSKSQLRKLHYTIYNVSRDYYYNMANLPIWANSSTDIMTSKIGAFVIGTKVNQTIHTLQRSPRIINNFQSIFIPEGKCIKEAINSGERSFMEFLKVYEKGKKFKQWITEQSDDINLLREYYKSISSRSWIEKLPNKLVRWIFFTGGGMTLDALGGGGIGTAAGIGLSALDTFVLDKLVNGWKPHQYVDSDLTEFLK